MPELPEVEHARRQLSRALVGRRLAGVVLADPTVVRTRLSTSGRDAHPDAVAVLDRAVGRVIGEPIRRGKRLGLRLGAVRVLVHLGMTGRWIRREGELAHGRLALDLDDGQRWWFQDPRRFGCVVPVDDLDLAMAEGLGPDALVEPLDGPGLAAALTGRRAIKVALMDQTKLAGIGNIQATEALWRSRIHPARTATSLAPAEWARLAEALQWTLHRTLDDAGEDELVYLSQDKERNPFLVYGRVGEPCAACGTPIAGARIGGRTSPHCPACQPDPHPTG